MKRRIFISTGEVSGDLQGAALISALRAQAQSQAIDLDIVALGGNRMQEAGGLLVGDTRTISSIGLIEAIPQILPTLRLYGQTKAILQAEPPDLAILIDYIGPNLKIGRFLRRQFPDMPIVYYIAPQEWAWSFNDKNSNSIAEITDRLLAIFPEEAHYYQRFGLDTEFIGHPLIDQLRYLPKRDEARAQLGIPPEQIALLLSPASRLQELKYLLPTMFEAAQILQSQISQLHFWIPLALPQFRAELETAIATYGLRATIVPADQGRLAIAAADLAITKSGTINLEMALLQVPQVVTYRLTASTAWIARHILKIKLPFVSPVNLILMREIVPELIQEQMTAQNIVNQVLELLQPARRAQMLADYETVRTALGDFGVCDRAANKILGMLPPV